MILRSIEVEGWRCFASSVHVGPFVDGLNIIHGPNGIGKSSLMMALARGLFDSHNVGGDNIKSLRPWGRELAPKVTIEFEQNGRQFRLQKQFLDSASAKLAQKEHGRFVPIAESRAADERAREILAGKASARGASDQRHWGLAQILWATQGSLKIDALASGTRATIQDALGAQIAGSGTEHLEQRIADGYLQFFTATGKLKTGVSAPAIVNLESQLGKAKGGQEELQQRLQDFETASRRIEDLRLQTQTARRNEQELKHNLEKARAQVQAYQILLGKQKQHLVEVSAANESHRNLADRIESIRKMDTELATTSVRLKQLREELPAQEMRVAELQEQGRIADQKVKQIRRRRKEVTVARQLAQLAQAFDRNHQARVELEKQLKQVEATEEKLNQLSQARKPIIAPDKKTLQKINRIARQRDDARLQLDAASIRVNLKLDADTEIEITNAEVPGLLTISQNDQHEIKGAPDVAFRIPGVGQFRATGPADDFETLRRQWESATASFDELTTDFGTRDIATLEALHARADALDQEIAQSEIKLETLLDGGCVEELRSDLGLAKNTLNEIFAVHADWKMFPPDSVEMMLHAEETEKKISGEIEDVEDANDRVKEELRKSLQMRDGLKLEIASHESQTTTLQQRLGSLCIDGLDDKLRAEKLTEVALQRNAAQGKLTLVETQIQELGGDPAKSLAMLEEQQQAFRSQADNAEKKLNIESGRLEQIISEAPYSALVDVQEEIVRLEEEIDRQSLQIDAVRLLYETVNEQKREVMQSLTDPIQKRANLILQRISGTQFEGVQFDESLLPTGIAPRSHDDAVSLDQISGGEQEQVHFAVRMALADVAFPHDRQLVVLDDVFTYTDAPRLARIAAILDEAAERFQIVLLTCHPERYRDLASAQFFDLENIAASFVH